MPMQFVQATFKYYSISSQIIHLQWRIQTFRGTSCRRSRHSAEVQFNRFLSMARKFFRWRSQSLQPIWMEVMAGFPPWIRHWTLFYRVRGYNNCSLFIYYLFSFDVGRNTCCLPLSMFARMAIFRRNHVCKYSSWLSSLDSGNLAMTSIILLYNEGILLLMRNDRPAPAMRSSLK